MDRLKAIDNNIFQPNNRLKNALENPLNFGFSCNFLQVEDSLDSISNAYNWILKVCANSGAPSIDVSRLSPKGTALSRGGVSSGVLPFIEAMDAIARSAKRELNKNHAGLIGIDATHPELDNFLDAKLPMLSKVVYLTNGTTLTKEIIDKLTNYYKKQPKLFFHKRKHDFKGVNLCTEIKDMESRDTCILGSFNLAGYSSKNEFANNFHIDFAESAIALVEIDKELKERYRHKRSYYELVSLSSNNHQVGLSCIGVATLLGHWGLNYSSFIGSDLESIIRTGYYYAAQKLRSLYPEYVRVFTQAPTVHSHTRFKDMMSGHGVSRSIEPLQGYDFGHEDGLKTSVVISEALGNKQYYYHKNTVTVQETDPREYLRFASNWQQIMDTTRLAQTISFSWFDTDSDGENAFGTNDFEAWHNSPLSSLYYYVPTAKITSDTVNDKFGESAIACNFDSLFDATFDCECAG